MLRPYEITENLDEHLSRGGSLTCTDESGWTLLHHAVWINSLCHTQRLLDAGADPKIRDENGRTPMHLLRDQGVGKDGSPSRVKGQATQAKVIASLVAAGADINAHDADGRTPIHACLDTRQTCSNPDALPALVSCGACINARDNLGRTPLHYSIRNPSSLFPTVPMLVELGADINAMDNEGRTPLHCSILNSAPHVFALLVDRGADLTLRDHRGLLPIDYAYQRCIPAMTKYLRQHGSPAGNTGRRASVMFLRVLSDVFG